MKEEICFKTITTAKNNNNFKISTIETDFNCFVSFESKQKEPKLSIKKCFAGSLMKSCFFIKKNIFHFITFFVSL